MKYKSLRLCSSSVVKDRRCHFAAFLMFLVTALYGFYMSEQVTRSSASRRDGKLGSLDEKVSATHVTNYTQNLLKTQKMLDLGWQGFTATCHDTVPSNNELRDSSSLPGSVEITYVTCCKTSRTGLPIACRYASTPMVIPRRNAEAIYAAGHNISDIHAERDFIFATGASASNYEESLVLVRIIQNRFPGRKIIYWDIGLAANHVAEVAKFCNVVYKQFDFTKYPTHVRKLTTSAFKPLCIMETLAEYSVIWWVDSSIRFTGDNVTFGLSMLGPRHGLVMFHNSDQSVWSTTYPQTYKYIATDELGLQRTVTCTGASFIIANTPEIFAAFLYWLYACVLDEQCIGTFDLPGYCNQQGPAVFAGCHRFDQSVMTILAANFWGFGSDNYLFQHEYFHLEREADGRDDVRRCSEK